MALVVCTNCGRRVPRVERCVACTNVLPRRSWSAIASVVAGGIAAGSLFLLLM